MQRDRCRGVAGEKERLRRGILRLLHRCFFIPIKRIVRFWGDLRSTSSFWRIPFGETTIDEFFQAMALCRLAGFYRGLRGFARAAPARRFSQPFAVVHGLGEIYR